jgi:hypothetical protein
MSSDVRFVIGVWSRFGRQSIIPALFLLWRRLTLPQPRPNDLTFYQTNLLLHQQENILNTVVFLRDLLMGDLCKRGFREGYCFASFAISFSAALSFVEKS